MNENPERKYLLIIGCQRSGTSLLASLLGNHPDINMLYESISKDIIKLFGKKWAGNKLLYPRQIRLNLRGNKFGYLVNRILNNHFWGINNQIRRPFPSSRMSIRDYMALNVKILLITRAKEPTVSSMIKRMGYSSRHAVREWEKTQGFFKQFKAIYKSTFSIRFEDLLENSESELNKICKFLDIPFHPDMLNGTKYNYAYPSDRIMKEKI